MDMLPPSSAIAPFAVERATLRRAVRRGDFPEGVEVAAYVREVAAHEPAATGGDDGGASSWSVAILASALPAGVVPAPGMTIDAGRSWPRLFVRKASRLGCAWHLECAGDARGASNG